MAGLKAYRGNTSTPEGEFMRQVGNVPILNGQLVRVTFTASDSMEARHSLGRPYVGAFVVASTAPTSTPMITAKDAALAAKAGVDPSSYVALGAETSWSGTVIAWVF